MSEEQPTFDVPSDCADQECSNSKSVISCHCTRELRVAVKGKHKGSMIMHFICNYCKSMFQGPSTSSALLHLKQKHASKCPELFQETAKVKTLDKFLSEMQKTPKDEPFQVKLTRWIIKTDQPFSVLDCTLFRSLLGDRRDEPIPRRTAFVNGLHDRYQNALADTRETLSNLKSKYSITCDVWTSPNSHAFLGVTIHYINDSWVLTERLLAFKFLTEDHTGENLAKALLQVLDSFGITDRLLGVTMDNASNNETMMQSLERHYDLHHPSCGFSNVWNRIECMAHVINLAAKQILKPFSKAVNATANDKETDARDTIVSAVSRISVLTRKIRDSNKLRRLLQTVCENTGTKYLVPIIDVATRWNSTHDMLKRALALKTELRETAYRSQDDGLISCVLSDEEWHHVQKLVDVLQPLKEVTLEVSKRGTSLCISHMLTLYQAAVDVLNDQLQNIEREDDMHASIKSAVEKLEHYYDGLSPIAGIAFVLNPAMKEQGLKDVLGWKDEWIQATMSHLADAYNHYRQLVSVSTASQEMPPVQQGLRSTQHESVLLSSIRKRRRLMITSNAEDELVRYLQTPPVSDLTDIIDYWKTHQAEFPTLAAMAKDYLTVQASSVSAERAFSSGVDLIPPTRCSLAPETIEMVQFLKYAL